MTTVAASVKTELEAQWNAVVITEPTMVNEESAYVYKNRSVLFVADLGTDHSPATVDKEQYKKTLFTIRVATNSSANAELMYSEIERIIRAKQLTSGWWEVLSHSYEFIKRSGAAYWELTVTGQETVIS